MEGVAYDGDTGNIVTYKLIIFDFDGTLADSFPWFLHVFDTLAERYRFKHITEQEGAMLRGLSARQIIQHLGIPAWKLPLIARQARLLATRDRAQIALFPGVDTMLAQLHAMGITLAVVSSKQRGHGAAGAGTGERCAHHVLRLRIVYLRQAGPFPPRAYAEWCAANGCVVHRR